MTRSDQASFHSYYDLCPWSPDGARLVFSAEAPGEEGSDVYWMDVAGGELHLAGHSRDRDAAAGWCAWWTWRGSRWRACRARCA
jgi:hypothetical protein